VRFLRQVHGVTWQACRQDRTSRYDTIVKCHDYISTGRKICLARTCGIRMYRTIFLSSMIDKGLLVLEYAPLTSSPNTTSCTDLLRDDAESLLICFDRSKSLRVPVAAFESLCTRRSTIDSRRATRIRRFGRLSTISASPDRRAWL
jgi:hypothetical protein